MAAAATGFCKQDLFASAPQMLCCIPSLFHFQLAVWIWQTLMQLNGVGIVLKAVQTCT